MFKRITPGFVWTIGLVLILLAGWLGYARYWTPRWQKIAALKQEIAKTDADIAQTRIDIEKFKLLLVELAKQQAQLEEVLKKLFPEKKVSLIVRRLIQEKNQGLNLEFISIQPAAIKTEGQVKILPVALNIKGKYRSILTYANRLEQEPALKVRQISLTSPGRPDKDKPYLITATINFDAFLLPDKTPPPAGEPSAEGALGSPRPILSRNDPFADARVAAVEKEEQARLLAQPELLAPTFRLQGVWLGRMPKAFINDEVLSVGDNVSGWKIVKITSDGVVLTAQGKKYTLRLVEE